MIRYSAATRGFYDDAHPAIPADAVEIAAERHAALLDAQAQGAEIVPGPDGVPVERWPAPPSEEQIMAARRAGMVVSRFQARAALMDAGLLADVELAIAASGDPLIQLAWTEATEFRRLSPTIAWAAAALDLTDEQVDGLFTAASQISA